MPGQGTIEVLDGGDVIARGALPAEALIEGEHGQVKSFEWSAEVVRDGRAETYRALDPQGNVVAEGRVIEGVGMGDPSDGLLRLASLDLRRGQIITAQSTTLTVLSGAGL